jgi:hypothetical protein
MRLSVNTKALSLILAVSGWAVPAKNDNERTAPQSRNLTDFMGIDFEGQYNTKCIPLQVSHTPAGENDKK